MSTNGFERQSTTRAMEIDWSKTAFSESKHRTRSQRRKREPNTLAVESEPHRQVADTPSLPSSLPSPSSSPESTPEPNSLPVNEEIDSAADASAGEATANPIFDVETPTSNQPDDELEALARAHDRYQEQQKIEHARMVELAVESLNTRLSEWKHSLDFDDPTPDTPRRHWTDSMLSVYWLINEDKPTWLDSDALKLARNRLRAQYKLPLLEFIHKGNLDDNFDFKARMRTIQPLTGDRFHQLTIVSYYGKSRTNNTLYLCQCDCGSTRVAPLPKLRNGSIKACKDCARARTVDSKAHAKKQNLYRQMLDTSMLKLPDS